MIMQIMQVLMAYPLCNLPCGDHVGMPQIGLRHGRTIVTHKHAAPVGLRSRDLPSPNAYSRSKCVPCDRMTCQTDEHCTVLEMQGEFTALLHLQVCQVASSLSRNFSTDTCKTTCEYWTMYDIWKIHMIL